MKIKNTQVIKKVEFCSIPSGEVFRYDSGAFPSLYMKIIATRDGSNAVDITTGKPDTFCNNTHVTKVDGCFVVQSTCDESPKIEYEDPYWDGFKPVQGHS